MSDAVVDASAYIELLLRPEGGDADLLLRTFDAFVVPPVFDAEVISALRRRHLRGLDGGRLLGGVARSLASEQIVRVPTQQLNARIVALAANLTPFDASYVALAEVLDLTLITADARLARASGPTCRIDVV